MCTVNYRHFSQIIPDNDEVYIQHFLGIIDSVDELAILEITKNSESYSFRLVPSVPRYNTSLITEILRFHNLFGIQINMSKSIKTSGTIYFEIQL